MKQNISALKKVKIEEHPVTFGSHGLKLIGKALLPDSACAESPVPGAVLCHGFGSSHRSIKESAQILTRKGIATFIFDFRGHGESEGALDGKMADDVVDAWNTLKQFPQVDKNRMGIVGHSLGALSAMMAAGKVDSPKALISLNCPQIIDEAMMAEASANFGHWGKDDNHIIEFPRHGTFPWFKGIVGVIYRIIMYVLGYRVRIDLKRFVRGLLQMNVAEVVSKLDTCEKLFVFCEDDTITPYQKSVLIYNAACEPKIKVLAKGHHGTSIKRGNLRSEWTTWAVNTLYGSAETA
jgi:pimeloyl-ACP methyl ester carboxylesterase